MHVQVTVMIQRRVDRKPQGGRGVGVGRGRSGGGDDGEGVNGEGETGMVKWEGVEVLARAGSGEG